MKVTLKDTKKVGILPPRPPTQQFSWGVGGRWGGWGDGGGGGVGVGVGGIVLNMFNTSYKKKRNKKLEKNIRNRFKPIIPSS